MNGISPRKGYCGLFWLATSATGLARLTSAAGDNGKPCLAGQEEKRSLQFSVSHSDAFAAYAFSTVGSIGVDIEKIREFPDMLKIVEQHFTQREKYEIFHAQRIGALFYFIASGPEKRRF